MIAPISQQGALGMQRSEIRQGVRMIILCKDGKGKIGLRIKAVNKVCVEPFIGFWLYSSLKGLAGVGPLSLNSIYGCGFSIICKNWEKL